MSQLSKDSEMETDAGSQASKSNFDESKFLNFDSFAQFHDTFSARIKDTVAASSKLGLKESDLEYFLAFPSFQNFINKQNDRILRLMGQVLKNQNVKKSNFNSTKLDDEERTDLLTDINDQLIEKLGIKLDELQGLRKKTETEMKLTVTTLNATSRNINTSWNKDAGMIINKDQAKNLQQTVNRQNTTVTGITYSQFASKKGIIQKSQLLFKDKIDNSYLPFVPKITSKPNALIPLPEIYQKLSQLDFEISQEVFSQNTELLENPYAYEIEQLILTDEDLNLVDEENSKLIPIKNATYKFIDSVDDLKWLCQHLGKENRSEIREIAVDLEHHSYRSFLGFTCLMQISTRDEDFLIDTLKLRSEMHILNEIFTDWTLLKVLHGADFDIEWLQKDFGIYVVNMFDTGQAARQLQYPHFSLSYLLQKFCNITAQKQYQLADWRIRPLSEGMVNYAREDTRYLLFIYDRLKNQLINQSLDKDISSSSLNQVFEKSKQICRKAYKKPVFFTKGFLNLCQSNSHLNAKQMKALQDLYKWRDKIARENDESCEFVLKNHQLLKIAELLPREIYGILALCNPISPIVETTVHEIHEIIKKAREFTGTLSSLDLGQLEKEAGLGAKPDVQESKLLETIVHSVTYDPTSILNCPHDFPHQSIKSESMETEQASYLEIADKSNLSDLLIRPTERSFSLPDEFTHKSVTLLDKFFDKTVSSEKFDKRLKKIEERVKEIRKQMKSPFEMFLPKYYQIEHNIQPDQYWNLIASSEVQKVEPEQEPEPVQSIKTHDTLMIPLKKQFKHEKNTETKKLKKKLKDVDFSEAIIEYNKRKNDQEVEALGDVEKNDEQFEKLSEKVKDNLKSISQFVKNANFSKDSEQFKYDPEAMNQMFSKAHCSEKEPKAKRFEDKFGKKNKRRSTNALTRSKNNKSFTFKKSN